METWPKVTPFVLQVGATGCPVWLRHELHRDRERPPGPFFRWDLRTRLLNRLRDAHATMNAPTIADLGSVPGGLVPEQRWYYERFVEQYCAVFADEPGETHPAGIDPPVVSDRLQLRVGGAVDLLLTLPDGSAELRQFELWRGRLCADPYGSWEMGLAVLRLYKALPGLGELTLRHVDLLSGEIDEHHLNLADHVRPIAESLDQLTRDLQERASVQSPAPGRSCGMCEIATSCSAWDDRPRAPESLPDPTRTNFVGPVVRLTPTSLVRWLDCPRAYRAAHLLDLPTRPPGPRTTLGIDVHAALAKLHDDGPCGLDLARQQGAAVAHGTADATRLGFITRHARRCPLSARSVGHELDLAQLHTWGPVPVMVTARIDAVWEHNGILDCRDYKTGLPRVDRVADDPAARLQAWLLAPVAAARGLRLQLSYEHLAEDVDDDPEPFEPEDDDIADIRRWIGDIGSAIAASDFKGVSDSWSCERCTFRAACPDAVLEERRAECSGPQLQGHGR